MYQSMHLMEKKNSKSLNQDTSSFAVCSSFGLFSLLAVVVAMQQNAMQCSLTPLKPALTSSGATQGNL